MCGEGAGGVAQGGGRPGPVPQEQRPEKWCIMVPLHGNDAGACAMEVVDVTSDEMERLFGVTAGQLEAEAAEYESEDWSRMRFGPVTGGRRGRPRASG